MEKIPEIKNEKEILLKELQKKVLFAMENSLDLELMQLKYILNKDDKEISDMIKKATITVETISEFRLILKILARSDEEIQDILAHENAHANKTETLGVEHLGYNIIIIKKGDDYLFQPFSEKCTPEEWSEEKKKEAAIQIVLAPEEYGNKLSSGDIEELKNLWKI